MEISKLQGIPKVFTFNLLEWHKPLAPRRGIFLAPTYLQTWGGYYQKFIEPHEKKYRVFLIQERKIYIKFISIIAWMK